MVSGGVFRWSCEAGRRAACTVSAARWISSSFETSTTCPRHAAARPGEADATVLRASARATDAAVENQEERTQARAVPRRTGATSSAAATGAEPHLCRDVAAPGAQLRRRRGEQLLVHVPDHDRRGSLLHGARREELPKAAGAACHEHCLALDGVQPAARAWLAGLHHAAGYGER